MKKAGMMGGAAEGILIPSYGKQKLLGYADSIQDLAQTFTYKEAAGTGSIQDRQTSLMKRRFMEDREILADNLSEVSRIIRSLAEESYHLQPFRSRELKKIIRTCKNNGILLRSIYRTADPVRGMRLAVSLCADERSALTAEDAAEVLSGLFRKRLLPEKDSLFFLGKEYETVWFEEQAVYNVLTGAARATRENEKVSGDTCSFLEKGNGNFMMALSDGMGSGEKAMADSEAVIDLLEKLVEAGFSKVTATEMINGVLAAKGEEENMSTLDICDVDLYTGICELIKIGSSSTYIKREGEVEQIDADTLPLGIFHRIQVETQRRQLQEGDFIIMVSDGVVDGVGDEEDFREVLAHIDIQNPQEMANYILQFVLHKTMGKVRDDMTVLTMGIWENAGAELYY